MTDKTPDPCGSDSSTELGGRTCEHGCAGCDDCTDYDDEPSEPREFGCCLPPGECCMPGLHYPDECHTAEDYEQTMNTLHPTISIKVEAEKDGTFTTHMMITGLTSFAMANAASEHMQRLFCGGEIQIADMPPNNQGQRTERAQAK